MTFIELLGDALIVAGCLAAAIGCFILNRRVQTMASTERGIGKAVSEMSSSVGQFEKLLGAAEQSAREAATILDEQLAQARKLVARLETLKGAASRTGVTPRASPRSALEPDPLADVTPKGASAGAARSDRTAEQRLADLVQRRRGAGDGAAGLGRGLQS